MQKGKHMTKYIVSIATATTSELPGMSFFTTDCDVEPLVVDDGTGRTRTFDTGTDAWKAWIEAKEQYRASYKTEGWTVVEDPYNGADALTLTIERGGVRSDRVMRAMVIPVRLDG